jgi:hypothetical protein
VTCGLAFINLALYSLLRQGNPTLMADEADQMHHRAVLTGSAQRFAIHRLAAQELPLFGLNPTHICFILVYLCGVGAHALLQLGYRHFRQHSMQRRNARYPRLFWMQIGQ